MTCSLGNLAGGYDQSLGVYLHIIKYDLIYNSKKGDRDQFVWKIETRSFAFQICSEVLPYCVPHHTEEAHHTEEVLNIVSTAGSWVL